MTARALALLGLLAVAACGSGSGGAEPAASGLPDCATATAVGQPITAALLAHGCAAAGKAVRLTPYVCRGTGNLVVTYGRSVGGPLPLALLDGVPPSDPPTTSYGAWAAAEAGDPSDSTDVAGCAKGP